MAASVTSGEMPELIFRVTSGEMPELIFRNEGADLNDPAVRVQFLPPYSETPPYTAVWVSPEARIVELEADKATWRDAAERLSVKYDDLMSKTIERNCEIAKLHDALKVRTDERDAALAVMKTMTDNQVLQQEIMVAFLAAKDARIAELDTLLAQRPAPVPDTPKPAHDWTRLPPRSHEWLGR